MLAAYSNTIGTLGALMVHLQNPTVRVYYCALISLYWLRIRERISFRLAVLTYRSIHDTSRGYP